MDNEVEMAGSGIDFASTATKGSGNHLEKLDDLLRDAQRRQLDPSELELVKSLLSPPTFDRHKDSDYYTTFLSAALDASIKWKSRDLWGLAISQFEKVGTLVLDPATMCEALHAFGFLYVEPCLNQLVRIDATRNVEELLCFIESVKFLASEAQSAGALTASCIQAYWRWARFHREELCKSLPQPTNSLEQIVQLCLKQDGVSYALIHLVPLYTNDRVNRGTFLCELAVFFDSVKAFPDNAVKKQVVLDLLRAGMGKFHPLTADNHEQQFQTAYAALDIYLTRGGLKCLDTLFKGLSQEIQAIESKEVLSLVVTGSVYPFLSRINDELADKHPGVLALLQTHSDTLINSTIDAIFRLMGSWPSKSLDDTAQLGFQEWLGPLIEFKNEIFLQFLSRLTACTSNREQDLSPPLWRACFRTLRRMLALYDTLDRNILEDINTLVEYYARHHASLDDVDGALQEFDLLMTAIKSPFALHIFIERLIYGTTFGHDATFGEVVVLNNRLSVAQESPHQNPLGLVKMAQGITKIGSLSPRSKLPDEIVGTLSIIMRAWFKKFLLVSPPMPMSEKLQAKLAKLPVCKDKRNKGRHICHTIRDFLRGDPYGDKKVILLKNPRPLVASHLASCPARTFDGYCKITEHPMGIQVEKTDERTWRPAQWTKLRAYGFQLLGIFSDYDKDTLPRILGDDCQRIHDIVLKPSSAGPSGGPVIEGVKESTSEVVGTEESGATATSVTTTIGRPRKADDMDVDSMSLTTSPAKKRRMT